MNAIYVSVQGKEFTVETADGRCSLRDSPDAAVSEVSPGVFSIILDGKSFRVLASPETGGYTAVCGGAMAQVHVETERSRLLKKFEGAGTTHTRKAEIHAPMPALVVRVEVRTGEYVEKGEGLLVLEAMKMENELKAPFAGTVKKVLVEKGSKVEKGELMLLLE